MRNQQTIGEVSRRLGLPARTIRFYEARGVISAPARSESGYRLYTEADVRQLRLAKQARLLGLALPEVRALVGQAFASECGEFAKALLERIATQRGEVRRRIEELEALERDLVQLGRHVEHSQSELLAGQRVAECSFCPLIDEEGGEEK